MFDWQALSNFFIAIAVGLFLATVAEFISLDLVMQVNPKSEDAAAALFIISWMAQLAVIALAMTQFKPISSPSPFITAFSVWVLMLSIYASIKMPQTVLRWWGYV